MDSAQSAAADNGLPASGEATADATAANAGLLANVAALWDDLKAVLHDHLELAALEARRAGQSLVAIVVYGVVVAIMIVTAWMGLITAGVLWLIHLDLNASLAVLIGVMVNLAGAFGLVMLIRQTSHALRFPATVRALKPVKLTSEQRGVDKP